MSKRLGTITERIHWAGLVPVVRRLNVGSARAVDLFIRNGNQGTILAVETGAVYLRAWTYPADIVSSLPALFYPMQATAYPTGGFVSSGAYNVNGVLATGSYFYPSGIPDANMNSNIYGYVSLGTLTVAFHPIIANAGLWSYEAWVYPNGTGVNYLYIEQNAGATHYLQISLTAAGVPTIAYTDGVHVIGATAMGPAIPGPAGWHHIVVTRNSLVYTCYVDGLLWGTFTAAAGNIPLFNDGTTVQLGFGTSSTFAFPAVYQYVLSAASVYWHFSDMRIANPTANHIVLSAAVSNQIGPGNSFTESYGVTGYKLLSSVFYVSLTWAANSEGFVDMMMNLYGE